MRNPKNIGVIFDCDGTLLDSMEAWHSVDANLAKHAQVEFTRADQDYFTGATLEECADYAHNKLGIGASPQDVFEMIYEDMRNFYANESVLKPGVRRFVEGLYEAGVPMSVASSTSSGLLVSAMQNVGFADVFKAICSTDDVGQSKRVPAIYDAARDAMGTETARTWGFEDALYATRTLAGAGYNTVGVYDSDIAGTADDLRSAADLFIFSFEELSPEHFLEIATRRAEDRDVKELA